MRWRRKDNAIASQYKEATFSLAGEYNADCIGMVASFNYLGKILDRSEDNWPAVLRNVGKDCRVSNRLGKMLRWEGADPRVSAMLY